MVREPTHQIIVNQKWLLVQNIIRPRQEPEQVLQHQLSKEVQHQLSKEVQRCVHNHVQHQTHMRDHHQVQNPHIKGLLRQVRVTVLQQEVLHQEVIVLRQGQVVLQAIAEAVLQVEVVQVEVLREVVLVVVNLRDNCLTITIS